MAPNVDRVIAGNGSAERNLSAEWEEGGAASTEGRD